MSAVLFSHRFATQAATQPDWTALSAGGEEVAYGELARRVAGRARQLREAGLAPGARVALLQDRTMALCIDILACLAGRLSATVLSRREGVAEAAAKLKAARFALLVADAENTARGQEIAEAAGVAFERRGRGEAEVAPWDGTPPEPGDEALIIFTSGSSGAPKAVRISQSNLACNTDGLAEMTPIGPEDHFLHVMPLSHTNGICNQLIFPVAMGARVSFLPRFAAEETLAAMTALRPTVLTGVPTMLQRFLTLAVPEEATRALRMLRCGSAQLPRETQERIEAHLRCEVLVSYGQTELTCTNTVNPPGARKPGSVGRALPGLEMAVLLPVGTEPLESGEVGEVCFRGPALALGYDGQPPFDREAWFRTGDTGYVDADGYLFLTGRLKEIIIRGGENLSPEKIEELLLDQPGIEAACVVPAPHADLGEVPFAFVETIGEVPRLEILNATLAQRLSPTHRLEGISVVGRLPINRVGKVDRKELIRRAATMDAA